MTIAETFWDCCKRQSDGCWEWQRGKDSCGYGILSINSKMKKATRHAWEITHGAIPDGLCVLHTCDNPSCINPDHLFLGTQKDNAIDRTIKGRTARNYGESNGRAKITAEDADNIRFIYRRGDATQCELADKYGISQVQIGRILQDKFWVNHDKRRISAALESV